MGRTVGRVRTDRMARMALTFRRHKNKNVNAYIGIQASEKALFWECLFACLGFVHMSETGSCDHPA